MAHERCDAYKRVRVLHVGVRVRAPSPHTAAQLTGQPTKERQAGDKKV